MEIPQKPKKIQTEPIDVFNSSDEKQKMIDGLVMAIQNPKNRTNRYCWRHPLDETDITGIASLLAQEVVAEFAEKGWEVEVDDLSELDGTIVFEAH